MSHVCACAGVGGIYGAFLYYGSLQEDVFRYVSSEGKSFTEVWFLQVLEALFNARAPASFSSRRREQET